MPFKINFNRALILSFFWHLFWFFAVTIVIMPASGAQKRFSDISFLGSILDENASIKELKVGRLRSNERLSSSRELFILNKQDLYSERLDMHGERDYLSKSKPYKNSIDEILELEKKQPAITKEQTTSKPMDRDSEIEGEAKSRVILFKPPMPDCRQALFGQEGDIPQEYYKVKLRVLIGPDGNIKTADKLESSGYPEIDLIAMRYVKKWNFSPINPSSPQRDQEGIIFLELPAK